MSRVQSHFAEKPKSKRIHPAWRGVGCVSLLIFTLGVYASRRC
jgi:hypothetical protein